jgi:NAD(P)H-dependent flavin oxidoreductase YrpB (nitropropane dioxygenase family)
VLGIKYPIMCAGMGHVTGAELAAAVSNAGGIGAARRDARPVQTPCRL